MDKKSKLGYKKNSPYKNKESLLINSNVITTEDMAFPILAMGNGGETTILYPNTGDFIFPSSTKVKEMKIPKYQGGGYVVKKGDTLSKIAKELGVSVNDLANYNNLKDLNKISVGQNLKVPSASPSSPSSFDLRRDSILADFPKINVVDTNSYTVSKGDTLGSIAKKYNVSVSDLASYNNIQNINRIGEGQNIKIPANAKGTFSKNELVSEYQKEKNKPTPKIPVTYDDKKLYQGFDESKIDNEQVVMSHLKGKEPFVIVNKKTNTLRRYDKNGNLIGEMRVGLGYDQGDKFTINSKNKKVDRNTTPGGIYIVDEQKPNEDYTHLYDNNILLLKNQGGLRQATSIHQVPSNSPQRTQRLADNDLTNDDFSNGCVNCNREQYEKYLKTVMPGEKVVILPEEDGNYFAVKNGELSFTTNRNKEFGQYNFTPKSKTYRELNYDFKADTDLKRQYVQALKNEKQKLMKDLNLTSDEYDELAKRSYGIFGQESSFGQGSIAPWNDFQFENIYSKIKDTPEERNQRTLGLSQVNLSYLPQEFKERYGINETSLFYPYQAAVASMGVLADSLQATRNPKIRDQYPNMTPDNVYDYALTGYNKPKTLRAGKASGNNTYVQSVKSKYKTGGMKNLNEYEILSNYLPTLSPEEQDQFIDMYENSTPDNKMNILMKCGGMMKYQQGGSVPSTQPMPKGMQVPREMANAEVEGGETAMNPNGVLMQFNGPSHEQGGIPTMLEGGTKVFSDHLKVPVEIQKELGVKRPNKKTTYADISKRFPTEKHMQTLADTKDKYKRNAAEIQLQKNLAMLETLFFAQEQDKMMKEMSNPANMQMQQPMTVDGLQYAQYGDEINPRNDERFMKLDYSNLYYDPYRDRLVTRDDDSGVYSPARYSYSKPTSAQIQAHLEKYPNKNYQLEQQKKLKGLKQQVDPFSKNNIIPYVQGPNADAVRAIVDPFNKRNTIPYVKRKEEETGSMEKLREQLDPFGKNNTIPYVYTPQKSLRDLIDPFSPDNIIPYVEPDMPKPLPIPPDIIELPENRNTSSGGSKSTSSSKKVTTSTSTSTTTTPSKSTTALPPIPTPIASNPTKQPFNWLTYKPSYPSAQTKAQTASTESQEIEDAIIEEKYPFGINPKLLGSAIDVAAVLSDRVSIDSPALYNRQKNPMFNRFYEFDNLETQRLANQQIQSIMNSNMPEQVKQAQIAQITAQSQDQQARVDFANAQRYEQKREADLAKLQTYTDANLDTRIADYDNWRQRMARVKDMQNQFKSWRKQQLVGTLKDQLGYMEKLKAVNELNPYFERSWLTGTDRYKPQAPSALNFDPTKGYDTGSRQINLGDGVTATDMGDFYVIRDAKGEVKIQEKKEQKSNKMTKEQAFSMYKFGGYKY